MIKLTKAQTEALKMVRRRDWPAGEPRRSWLHVATAKVLYSHGLIADRPGSMGARRESVIIELTDAGRAALNQST